MPAAGIERPAAVGSVVVATIVVGLLVDRLAGFPGQMAVSVAPSAVFVRRAFSAPVFPLASCARAADSSTPRRTSNCSPMSMEEAKTSRWTSSTPALNSR